MVLQLRPERIVAAMDKDQSKYEFMFTALGPILLEKIPTIAREGHIKALAKSLIPEPRSEAPPLQLYKNTPPYSTRFVREHLPPPRLRVFKGLTAPQK